MLDSWLDYPTIELSDYPLPKVTHIGEIRIKQINVSRSCSKTLLF